MPNYILTEIDATDLNVQLTILGHPLVTVEQIQVQEHWKTYYSTGVGSSNAATLAIMNGLAIFPEETGVDTSSLPKIMAQLNPLVLTGPVNDLALPPGGVGYSISSAGNENITGIQSPPAGITEIWLWNASTANVVLKNAGAGSLITNQIKPPNNEDYTMAESFLAHLFYHNSLWRIAGPRD